ncbi:MAG: hypothetical protein KC431_24405, partial [Myxococcales bacterium]|nr:hypothetical protein [Myxococcales bacterium]
MRAPKTLAAIAPGVFASLILAGCPGDDGSGDDADGTGSETADGTDEATGDTGTSSDTGTTSDTGTSDTGTGDTGTDTSDTGDTGTTGGMGEGLELRLLPSSQVVLEENNGGVLAADCVLLEDGRPALVQPDTVIDISPADGATVVPEGWSFPAFGTWVLGCSAMVDGEALTAEREIAVLNDALDPRLAEVGGGLGSSVQAMTALLGANEQDDQQLVDAIAALEAAQAELAAVDLAPMDDVLRPVPGGYPSAAALSQAGILANADDVALTGALADVASALANLRAVYDGLDPSLAPTQADVDQLAAAGAELDAALAAASALEPTAHGWLDNRDTLAALVRDDIEPTMAAINGYAIARTKAEADAIFGIAPPGPGLTPKFGLISLTMSMFDIGYTRATLIDWFYGDAIAAADKSINNLILGSLIDYFLPPNPQGPVIEIFQASASIGFAVPGYDTWAY